MDFQMAKEEYIEALARGKKEIRDLTLAKKPIHPAVLDEILEDDSAEVVQELGLVEIPADRIIGVKSAGRISAFTPSFSPTLAPDSEFAIKWVLLCADHLGDTGIRDPILCYEYLGNFYVQEGNKRVSVLRHFGSPRIPGQVRRIVPPMSEEPRIKAYYEFMEFYKASRLYCVQYRRPGEYKKLLAAIGKSMGENWTEDERRTFNAYFQYFLDAFCSLNVKLTDILPEEALLLWLQVHPYKDLGNLSGVELKKSLSALWPDVVASTQQSQLKTETAPVTETKPGIISRIMSPDHVNVAFVHQLDPKSSAWVLGHEEGRKHIEKVFGEKITVRSYFDANAPEDIDKKLEQAIADGAQMVFTTAPRLSRSTLKMAVKYPKIRFYNCSVNQPYSSIQTYYGRMYEAKFITGAIAGAMAQDNRIGFIGSSPIMGMTASINAFALGAQLTNPRAQIELRWSCCEGNPQADFLRDGIRVISNREIPTQNRMYMDFCNYGTYLLGDRGGLIPLAAPVWVWGNFYEQAVSAYLSGAKMEDKSNPQAVNYWLGMDSGVIDVELSEKLPTGVSTLASMLRKGFCAKAIDPFRRKIVAQDGTVKNDGSRTFTPEELLNMDWLCENITGEIPTFDQILPMSQSIVRELGLYRDSIPAVKETVK
jgi:basic membrane lipoprotein Med (substrate-binding protein (PBP1-ABC) superfamily)